MGNLNELQKQLEQAKAERDKKLQDIKDKENKKLENIKKRIKKEQSKQKSQDKKDLTRYKIILGSIILNQMQDSKLDYYLGFVGERDKEFVTQMTRKIRLEKETSLTPEEDQKIKDEITDQFVKGFGHS